ncbi:hypothetical protein TNCV_4422241 [Trichonephila clavipes]|nr:hypothetical protein TNCV_4422241 [Trichonephila clavipes]
MRYGLITVNSTTLIELNSPRKNTSLPAVKSVDLRHTPNSLKPASYKVILEFVQSSKRIIVSDSDDENEMNYAAPVPPSSEMKSVMKSMRSYLDAHSNGEMYNKIDDIEQFDTIKNNGKKNSRLFPKTQ